MIVKIEKLPTNVTKLKGTIEVPGDKSISHRSIIFGSIAHGTTKVRNFLRGEDCLRTISCFRQLGVDIDENDEEILIHGKGFEALKEPTDILYTGNSGTTTRLLLGVLSGRPFFSVLSGDASMNRRPMKRVIKPLKQMGAQIFGRMDHQYLPLAVRGNLLKGITYHLPVASAQLKSALIFAGLQAEGLTTIIENEKTRNHTEIMLQQFGGSIEHVDNRIHVKGEQKLIGTEIDVPGDISSAAFFLAAACVVKNSEIIIKNVGLNDTRTGLLDVLKQMNAKIELIDRTERNGETVGTIKVQSSELQGTEIKGSIIPRLIDEIPIIALLATQAEGETEIRDAAELKVKESNRVETVVSELSKLGAKIEATNDGMVIYGKTKLKGGLVDSHGDHRIGMMLSIAALLCEDEVQLKNADCIQISYPSFFVDLQRLVN